MVTSPRRSKRTRKGGVRITTSKRTRGQEAAPSTDLVEPVADSGRSGSSSELPASEKKRLRNRIAADNSRFRSEYRAKTLGEDRDGKRAENRQLRITLQAHYNKLKVLATARERDNTHEQVHGLYAALYEIENVLWGHPRSYGDQDEDDE